MPTTPESTMAGQSAPATLPPATPGQTPSQTVGPFFGYALPYDAGPDLLPPHAPGTIHLHGTVYDGEGDPVPDAIIEIWQGDEAGAVVQQRGSLHRDGYTFTGFGRAAVDGSGRISFTTVKPGAMRAGAAPYILVTVFARGLLHHLFTRAYFSDESAANEADALLQRIDPARRATLIAEADGERSYRFDIHLQGADETVFFDFGVEYPGQAHG
jgi:protocatechuate 3,4-dioxygenase, alpha subunit